MTCEICFNNSFSCVRVRVQNFLDPVFQGVFERNDVLALGPMREDNLRASLFEELRLLCEDDFFSNVFVEAVAVLIFYELF